ncbi:MAG: HAD family hydrolase [Clostridiales bacterium]|nr:HAD family hydrolase [Clostridiales bacterium]
MIKTILFDIDDTLYSYTKADAAAFPALAAYAGEKFGVPYDRFFDLYWKAYREQIRRVGHECGATHSRVLRCQILLEWLGQPLIFAREMEGLYWNTLLDAMEPTPGVEDCLRTLKSQGYRLGIGTDLTAGWQLTKLERLGFLPYFDFMVCSEEAGADKPAPRFFALCLEKAGCGPENCLFVGDNPRRDVAGANRAGMHGVLFRPEDGKDGQAGTQSAWFRMENAEVTGTEDLLRIRSMSELPALAAAL